MRICVNGLSVVTGGGLVNLSGLLNALAAEDSSNEYLVLAPGRRVQHFITGAPNFHIRPSNVGEFSVLARVFWEQTRLSRLLAREGIDLLFSPANLAPLRLPEGCRSVVKVQNIAPFSRTAFHLERGTRARLRLRALRGLTLGALRGSDAAIHISSYSARVLAGRARYDEVVYDGLTTEGGPVSKDEARLAAEARFGISSPFVLCVADFYPYKNIENLVRGFALLPVSLRRDLKLVLVGRPMVHSYARDVRREVERQRLGDAVEIIEGTPRQDLELLYHAASVYAFPSRVEAGGTTLVEAMAAGLPIVASRVDPLPEFAGPAALYCHPQRPGEWASALMRALTDVDLAGRLREAGLSRARGFRWEDTARRTLDIFERVARGHTGRGHARR